MNTLRDLISTEQHPSTVIYWQGVMLMTAFFLITMPFILIDERTLQGQLVWIKPLKFSISTVVHLATLAILALLLSRTTREAKAWTNIAYVTTAATSFEVIYIFLQAARGRASHFNIETATEILLYSLMGVGALIMVFASFYLGRKLFKEQHDGDHRLLKMAAGYGLVWGSIFTLAIAGYMSTSGSRYAHLSTEGSLVIPWLGWSLTDGDMRIPHFFATHMMQIIPLYGFLLERAGVSYESGRNRILLASAVYALAVVGVFAWVYVPQ